MRKMRAEGVSWEHMAPQIGMSRYWCHHVAVRHGFGEPLGHPSRPKVVSNTRLSAGLAPLPAFHPLAMAELRRAERMAL
jgi:hypothetical protein